MRQKYLSIILRLPQTDSAISGGVMVLLPCGRPGSATLTADTLSGNFAYFLVDAIFPTICVTFDSLVALAKINLRQSGAWTAWTHGQVKHPKSDQVVQVEVI